jgi:hypothetical protein
MTQALSKNRAVPPPSQWRYQLLGELESTRSLRVCTTEDLVALVRRVRPSAALVTARAAIGGLVQAKALSKVSKGVYLNRRCKPSAELSEVAQVVRRGAVVSLETVLGECGFLNNPPAIVTAVLSLSVSRNPNVGEVKTSGGQVFRFHALPQRFFPSTPEDERLMLQAGRFCPVAKPEAAVLHWLHLADSPRSSVLKPPQDVDFSVLDTDLLKALAWRWGQCRPLEEWMQLVERTGDIQEPSEPSSKGVDQPRATEVRLSERAAQARARMQARQSR